MVTVDALGRRRGAGRGPTSFALRQIRIIAGTGILIGVVLGAILAPWIAPDDPYAQDLGHRRVPPPWLYGEATASWRHPLGTDNLGRDYLSRILYGARISLAVGVAATAMSGVIGASLGVAAGYLGGRVDALVNFVLAVRLSLPIVLVALAAVALYGGSLGAIVVVLASSSGTGSRW
jgi:peptide/nickel transport system permease protein